MLSTVLPEPATSHQPYDEIMRLSKVQKEHPGFNVRSAKSEYETTVKLASVMHGLTVTNFYLL